MFCEMLKYFEDERHIDLPTKEGESGPADVIEHPETRHVNINVNIDKSHELDEKIADAMQNRDEERTAALHAAFEAYHIEMPTMGLELVPGTEDFGQFVRNLIIGLANKITGAIYLLKTALFDGWRDLKRTELEVFCQNHSFDLTAITRQDRYRFEKMVLEHPEGMVGSYMQAADTLAKFFNELDMHALVAQMRSITNSVRKSLGRGSTEFISVVDSANRDFRDMKVIERAFEETSKVFTTKKNDSATFKVLYDTPQLLKKTVDKVSRMDVVLKSVAGIVAELETIENEIKNISNHPNIKELPKKHVELLSKMVFNWAVIFEKFSIVTNDLYRVNHNITINLINLMNALDRNR